MCTTILQNRVIITFKRQIDMESFKSQLERKYTNAVIASATKQSFGLTI